MLKKSEVIIMTYIDISRSTGASSRHHTQSVTKAEAWALLKLAAPLTGLALVNMAMSVTDTLMTAAFGIEALAAVAVASDFYSICFYLAVGCIGGLGPLYAAAHVAGDADRLARLRTAGNITCALLALPICTLLWNTPAMLCVLGIDQSLVEAGTGYVRAMALTLVPMLAVGVLRTRLTAIERPGVMLRITLCAVPLNAVFNYVFMYGAFGLPEFGVTGAGLSSLLVGLLTLAALTWEVWRTGDSGAGRVDPGDVAEIFRIGVPIGIATLAEVGIYLGATIYAASLTVTDAAAHSVAIRLAGVGYTFYFGLQQAAMTRLARMEPGSDREHEVRGTAMLLGVTVGLSLCIVLLAIASPVADYMLRSSAPAAVSVAIAVIGALAVAELSGPAGAAAAGLLRARKVTRPVMIYSLIGNWVVAAPLIAVSTIVFDMGAIGIWIAMATGTIVYSGLCILALRRHLTGGAAT
ncbi:MATE family efflux transporter [Sulfitobacter sp. D35]|uniref:MATE family efflux transporter n=1 Tax=Sulfitobacter sp. D35 TaxID=3083252 RepID=UPI00296EFBC9|nr:MATE family efflux transporter [Sulfitobacter sp. D35]MDW4500196.1 MATE family efflux transporter [Sulfitobacter sp. D35]